MSTSPPVTPTRNDAPEESSKLKRSGSSQIKKKPEDFIFGKVIGEGSYSTVCLIYEFQKRILLTLRSKEEFILRDNIFGGGN